MSTSDQQGPLTRKQLRELRMTGSTPVVTADDAEASAAAVPPAPPLPRAAEPADIPPPPAAEIAADSGAAPLTRRQAREQERIKTASVPVVGEDAPAEAPSGSRGDDAQAEAVDAPTDESSAVEELPAQEHVQNEPSSPEIVSEVPSFAAPVAVGDAGDDDDLDDAVVESTPVSAADAVVDTVGDLPIDEGNPVDEPQVEDEPGVEALGIVIADDQQGDEEVDPDDVLADVHAVDDDDVTADERPTVASDFGSGLLADAREETAPVASSFDDLLSTSDSTGSHVASSALIFNRPAGEGSLSGPVASTGEILVTGSYELPKGIGSQGHAHGTADGKDVDAVLIDGELPPASSPTPIAASAAVSTIKPAGEVIRPPAPEKGNKLLLVLAIVAGGLALAVGVAVVIAITTNVF